MTREEFDKLGFKVGDTVAVSTTQNIQIIKYIGGDLVVGVNPGSGKENPWWIHLSQFTHVIEPEPQKRWARAAYLVGDKWDISSNMYSSLEEAKKEFGRVEEAYKRIKQFVYPARFDSEGFLIIPEEFK